VPIRRGSRSDLGQITRTQGIDWGGHTDRRALWFDGDLYTDAAFYQRGPVFDADAYGCVGDGVTDDLNQLNAVFAAASAARGVVRLTPGKTYVTSDRLSAAANATVWGYGAVVQGTARISSGQRWYGVTFRGGVSVLGAGVSGFLQFDGDPDDVRIVDCTFDFTGTLSTTNGLITCNGSSATNVVIRGCSFTCAGGYNGVLFSTASAKTVRNVKIEGCSFNNVGRMAIELTHASTTTSNIQIRGNTIRGTGKAGGVGIAVSIAGAITDVVIAGNHIEDHAGVGVEIANSPKNWVIAHNVFALGLAAPIQTSSTGALNSFGTIANNVSRDPTGNWDLQKLDNCTVVGNLLSESRLILTSCTNVVVAGNNVQIASGGVITLDTCDDCLIDGNRFESQSTAGSQVLTLTTCTNCKVGINHYFKSGGNDFTLSGGSGNTVAGVSSQAFATGSAPAQTFTDWAAFTPTWGGFSVNPTATTRYVQIGKIVFVEVLTTVDGTSNATTFTMTLPVNAANAAATAIGFGRGVNAGAAVGPSRIDITAAGTATFRTDNAGNAWTASGNKSINCCFFYEAA
jgi:hypothetical protein